LARKILLADDSVTAQNMGRKILADAGYEIVTVNNGSAALKKIAELKPDLVILDVYMPGYSGLEVCQRLKESHDSARIPVLLSVGKLEPFKPEEAQRVRADGYIVKPFEASELLSALSKLEDKVVPRSEPSRTGRFARAVAPNEENAGLGRGDKSGEENGWRSRIGFPVEKKEPEEKVADDASIYNPMNRDLRTVVETPTERATEKHNEKQDEKHEQRAPESEPTVDVAALVPPYLPSDVTAEEVAAIAAASAQIQMAADAAREDTANSAAEIPAPQVSPVVTDTIGLAPSQAQAESPEKLEVKDESAPQTLTEIAPVPLTDVAAGTQEKDHEKIEEDDIPVTMAAAAAAGASNASARWMAVGVALQSDEANISLELEMQKAYAAFLQEGINPFTHEAQPIAPQISSSSEPVNQAISVIETPIVAALAAAEAATIQDHRPELIAEAADTPASSHAPETSGGNPPEAAAELPQHESAPPEPTKIEAETEAKIEVAEQPAEPVSPSLAQVEGQSVIPEPAASSVESVRPETDAPQETETVKSAAAAWASWRQIRDASESKVETPEPAQQYEVSQLPTVDAAAMAAAAGAEHSPQELAATENATQESGSDIASIVDSVLADLRPKLMAEISRKMAEKK
jgi:CheY-like chemotaxis protein